MAILAAGWLPALGKAKERAKNSHGKIAGEEWLFAISNLGLVKPQTEARTDLSERAGKLRPEPVNGCDAMYLR